MCQLIIDSLNTVSSDPASEEDASDEPLSAEQIRLAKESWRLLAADPEPVGELFYQHLFELEPDLKEIFAGTFMSQQVKKFTDTRPPTHPGTPARSGALTEEQIPASCNPLSPLLRSPQRRPQGRHPKSKFRPPLTPARRPVAEP